MAAAVALASFAVVFEPAARDTEPRPTVEHLNLHLYQKAEIVVGRVCDGQTPDQSKTMAAKLGANLLFDLRGPAAVAFIQATGGDAVPDVAGADRVLIWRHVKEPKELPILVYRGGCAVWGAKFPVAGTLRTVENIRA